MKKKRPIKKIILILLIIFGLFTARAAFSTFKAFSTTKKAAGAAQLQDLDATKSYLKDAKKQWESSNKSLYVFTPLRIIPLFGWYIADAQRITYAASESMDAAIIFADAVTPYADVLGLKGQGTFLGGTAQERIAKAVETLAIVAPKVQEVGNNLDRAGKQVEQIDSWRYPNFLPGKPGQKIDLAKDTFVQLRSLIVETEPLLAVTPKIMGQDRVREYLIIFQNDKELRATGGFITAYAYFRVEKGKITSDGSSDIYELDNKLLKTYKAPEIILKYLPNVPNLNIRDSNLSPDYFASMKTFEEMFQNTHEAKVIDGIIALDTNFVLSMMEVLGPIEAADSKFTTDKVDQCDCPQIIYELEKYADEPVAFEKGNRKGIIGVLMSQMMDKAFNAPKSQWPALLATTTKALRDKSLILYFLDEEIQKAAEKMNFAGRIHQYDGDYLHINESNFAGAKSNLYVQEKVKLTVKEGKNDTLEKKLTLEYKYPRKMDNCSLERKTGLCLAGIYRDVVRIYVPKGSKIKNATSINTPFTEKEDLSKTVFEGFFELKPEGALKIEIEYTSPLKVDEDYKLLIQKQPGVLGHTYEVEAFGKRQKPFPLDTDKELIVKR